MLHFPKYTLQYYCPTYAKVSQIDCSLFYCPCLLPLTTYRIWFKHPNIISWRVQFIKFLNTELCPSSYYNLLHSPDVILSGLLNQCPPFRVTDHATKEVKLDLCIFTVLCFWTRDRKIHYQNEQHYIGFILLLYKHSCAFTRNFNNMQIENASKYTFWNFVTWTMHIQVHIVPCLVYWTTSDHQIYNVRSLMGATRSVTLSISDSTSRHYNLSLQWVLTFWCLVSERSLDLFCLECWQLTGWLTVINWLPISHWLDYSLPLTD
jgi:hypothetical protein